MHILTEIQTHTGSNIYQYNHTRILNQLHTNTKNETYQYQKAAYTKYQTQLISIPK